jgi:hypothetical protein
MAAVLIDAPLLLFRWCFRIPQSTRHTDIAQPRPFAAPHQILDSVLYEFYYHKLSCNFQFSLENIMTASSGCYV